MAWSLGVMSAFGPFAIDMYLPAFPRLARDLHTPIGTVQMTLAIFLLGLAVGQILWGTLSDHLGRRMPLLSGCVLFSCMAAVCATAHSIHTLVVARFFMGLGGSAGVVVARAIVRDMFQNVHADHRIGLQPGQIAERAVAGFAGERVQVIAAGVALAKDLDAGLLAIQSDHQLAVEQQAGEIADAAAHLHHALAQFARHQTALPGEVVLRPGHLSLVFQGKRSGRLPHRSFSTLS